MDSQHGTIDNTTPGGHRSDLERRVEVLEAVIAQHPALLNALAATPAPTSESASENLPVERRKILRWAGAAAASAVAGGAVIGPLAAPAAAADGDPLILGQSNQTSTSFTDVGMGGLPPFGLQLRSVPAAGANTGKALLSLRPLGNLPVGIAIEDTLSHQPATTGIIVTADTGVVAASPAGTAIEATSVGGTGIVAYSVNGSVLHLERPPQTQYASAAARPVHLAGDLDTDTNHDVWWCTADADAPMTDPAPGHWRKVAGPATAGALHALSPPVRIYDSRPGLAPVSVGPKTPMVTPQDRMIAVNANNSAVPSGATAVLVNVAVTDTTGTGFLGLFPVGSPWPGTANVNWDHPNATVSNLAMTAVDADASFTVHAGGNGQLHIVVDLLAYYR